jgi:hypothetical protein
MESDILTIKCPRCGNPFNVKKEWIGRKAKCRTCQTVFAISSPEGMGRPASGSGGAGPTHAAPPAPPVPVVAAHPSAAQQPAPAAPSPPSVSPPLEPEGAIGLGRVFQWLGEGIKRGLCCIIPLTAVILLSQFVSVLASALCVIPAVFLDPPITGGLVLVLLAAARGEKGLFGRLFAGFSEGRFWPSMGIYWLLCVVFGAASIPTMILLLVVGIGSVMLIVEKGLIGLLVLAILMPIAFAPTIYLSSRLAWAMPLVMDRRVKVGESLGMSWRLTGRVAHGFGMFVMLVVLSLVGLVGSALVLGTTLAAFNITGLAAIKAAAPGDAGVDRLKRNPGENDPAYEQRKLAEEFRRIGKSMPPRPPGESDAAYKARAQRVLAEATRQDTMKKASQVLAVGVVGLLAAGGIFAVLSAALAGVLAVPGMVGYRDMTSPAKAATG